MAAGSEFVVYVLDQLAPLGGVTARAMFGGYGLYQDGLFFAIIADDVLNLKTGEGNRPAFEARGLVPFTYQRGGQARSMKYFEAPPETLEDQEMLVRWARGALAASLRAWASG